MKNLIVIMLLLLVIFSCSNKTKPTASQTATVAQPSPGSPISDGPVDMAIAENQFKTTCASCHKLPLTTKHYASEWPAVVTRMQRKKPGFDDAKKALILAYLSENAKN